MNEVMRRFIDYFVSIMKQNNMYFFMFVLCEFLNMIILVLNFYLTNSFFSFKWGAYGFEGSDSMVLIMFKIREVWATQEYSSLSLIEY